ncbi:uncharacterized protein LOC115738250 [Rhodamnia argentea]|uniref:Uncharacterized protein LOC115738250 n=1 Tax=Rhodamnia argentea TaxID=178133 RepID=A0A8B8NVX8_9MYRT|nr:uncharacterized protein LOC115738250 [Rhodamnia argentea]
MLASFAPHPKCLASSSIVGPDARRRVPSTRASLNRERDASKHRSQSASPSSLSSSSSSSPPSSGQRRRRRPQNVDGDFFVDGSCIDCDTCCWMAPQIFTRVDEMSAVFKQPANKEERLKALQALISCPTSSIHTDKPAPDVLMAHDTFPIPIDEQKLLGVYHCGYHSEKSYGASSYLILRAEGNILIDSPRYTGRLARKIEMLGGVHTMFLTHKDDIADHKKWRERLGCYRILHSDDLEVSTAEVEIKLEGRGPWNLGRDIELIHTPGHTEGSVCLLYKPLEVIFTGDHLIMTPTGLSIIEQYNRCSVAAQLNSVKKLVDLDFRWIVPGHGRRIEFKSSLEKDLVLKEFVQQKSSQFAYI